MVKHIVAFFPPLVFDSDLSVSVFNDIFVCVCVCRAREGSEQLLQNDLELDHF